MTESPFKTFLRGSAISLFGTGILGVLNYFIRRTLSIELTEAEYGVFYSTLALLSMIYGYGDLGIAQSGTALIAKNSGTPRQNDFFGAVFFLKIGFGFVAFVGVCCFSPFLAEHYLKGAVPLILIFMAAVSFWEMFPSAFRTLWDGLKMFWTFRIFQIALSLLILTGMLIFVRRFHLAGAIGVYLVSTMVIAVLLVGYSLFSRTVNWRFRLTRDIWKELFQLSGWLAVSSALLASLPQLSTVMLTSLKGVNSAAAYNIALPVMQILQSVMIFPAVFLPVAIGMSRQRNFVGLRHFTLCGIGAALLALPVTFIFFSWAGEWLIVFLFDGKYRFVAPALPWLCASLVFSTLGQFLVQALVCLGRTRIIASIAICCFLCNIILNWLLIWKFDFVGAAEATFVSYFIFALLCVVFLIAVLQKNIAEKEKEESAR